jgi:hypothetical protein
MRSRQRILAYGLFAIVTASACGDDDGNSAGGGVSTGIPATEELSSLSNDDTVQVCTKTAMALNNLLPTSELERIACVNAAATEIAQESGGELGSSDIPMCKQLSSQCQSSHEIPKADLAIEVADETECGDATTGETFGDCAATIADYERCVGRIMNELRTRLRSFTCDSLNDLEELDETLNGKIDVSETLECRALKTKCPDVNLTLGASD